jgi:hypothetical protein
MAKQSKKNAWAEDGDSAHWTSAKKRPARKATTAKETKKRFKENTVKVHTSGKKTHKTAKIKM